MLLSALMEETVRNKLIPALGQISQMNPDPTENYDAHSGRQNLLGKAL